MSRRKYTFVYEKLEKKKEEEELIVWFNLVHLINIDINTTNNNNLENNDEPRVETNDNMVKENIDVDGDSNSSIKDIYDLAQWKNIDTS